MKQNIKQQSQQTLNLAEKLAILMIPQQMLKNLNQQEIFQYLREKRENWTENLKNQFDNYMN